MLASQLLYTACGRTRTGAYSVWSQSSDITDEDSEVIVSTMNYERPSHLPRIPTEEEPLSLYPKKTAYFKLPSGKYCIAQSAYIGRVYSDEDDRTGNFMIHAFVFEKSEEISPMLYVGSGIFKEALTYEEWHENDAPASLPTVKLPENAALLGNAELGAFLAKNNNWQRLERLLQAIILGNDSGEPVTFHDSHVNLPYWYRALSVCLPRSMHSLLTYCSFFSTANFYSAMPGIGGPVAADVMVRNVIPDSDNLYFSYSQEVQKGKYAFDFEHGIENITITVSKYVSSVVASLKRSIGEAMKTVQAVDALMRSVGCTPDEATELYHLQECDVEWFKDDWARMVTLAEKLKAKMPDDFSRIADGFYDYFFSTPNAISGAPQDLLKIYRMIFDYSEKADKAVIVEYYLRHQKTLGVKTGNDCAAYVKDVKEKAPFAWVNFVDYIFEEDHLSEYLKSNIQAFPALYLLYISLIEAWNELTKSQKDMAQKYFLRLTAQSIQKESVEEFTVLLSSIQKCGEKWETWLVKNALVSLMDDSGKVTDACSADFLLKLTKQLSKGELALIILEQLISENMHESFIRQYVKETAEMRDKFEQYEKELAENAYFLPFLERVKIFRFELLSDVTKSDLAKFYRDVYCKDPSDSMLEMFLDKVDVFLKKYKDAELIKVFGEIYSDWFRETPEDQEDINHWIAKKVDLIFNMDMEVLISYACDKGFGTLEAVLERLYSAKYSIREEYFVLRRGLEARAVATSAPELRKVRVTKTELIERLDQQAFYSKMEQQRSLNLFMRYFMRDMVLLYLKVWSSKTFEQRFENCFQQLAKLDQFEQYLLDALEKLEKQEYAVLLTALFSYAYSLQNAFAKKLRVIIERYLEAVGRGKRKKIFGMVQENLLPDYQKSVMRFIDDYRKNDLSFFDKLFGGSNKTVEDEDDKDDKKEKEKDSKKKKSDKK